MLKTSTSDGRKIFGNFTSGGDYVAALLCFSSLGHDCLIGTQHLLKKSTSDGRKIGDFVFGESGYGQLTRGADKSAFLNWNSSWDHGWNSSCDHGRRKFVNIISGESRHGQLTRGADKAAFFKLGFFLGYGRVNRLESFKN